jgi:hypothetical protein
MPRGALPLLEADLGEKVCRGLVIRGWPGQRVREMRSKKIGEENEIWNPPIL